MKVILLKDVKALGTEGELVEVNDGYARNYLIPRKIAIEANNSNMNVYKARKSSQEHKLEREIKNANKLSKKLENEQVVLTVKAGENGKLFGAVTNSDVAKVLKGKGYKIDKKKISLNDTIKNIGKFEATIKLYANISTKINVIVEKE